MGQRGVARVLSAWSIATVGTVAVAMAPPASPVAAQETGVANPPIADSCGTDVTLVLDASGSIQSSSAVGQVRDAGEAFLDALADTGSDARVLQFASFSEELAGFAEVTQSSLQSGGVFRRAIDDYYNPKPPRPNGVSIYSYDGSGNPSSSNNWRTSNNSNQYTNWQQSLGQAGDEPSELVVYITDGDPTAYDFDQAGDPFNQGPPPDVGVNTNRNQANAVTIERGIAAADSIKTAGTRMLVVGVGAALQNSSSRQRLVEISGPQVVEDDDLPDVTSINEVDVALVQDFDDLAAFLRGVVSELCSPSLSIRKLAQTPDDASYDPAPGWDITVTPTVDGGAYEWILPDTDPVAAALCGNPVDPNDGAPRTCETNAQGLANFQWEPDPSDASTSATVVEALQPGYTTGRPDADDWTCRLKNIDGTEETQSGELDDGNGFALDVDSQQIITCSIYNSFDYQPDIELTKVNAPTIVRGDLPDEDRVVTSTYTVSIPPSGNTPLSGVTLTDDSGERACSLILFVGGDTNGDRILDLDETWTFSCAAVASSASGNYDNIADVVGTSPDRQHVTDTATDDVDVVRPDIALTKVVSGAGEGPAGDIDVPIGTDVTYTFTATNTGDTTLDGVTLTDPNCDPGTITPASYDDVQPGASVDFSCTTANVTESVVNVAQVTGTPDIPGYTGPNPPVTANGTATVEVYSQAIELTKSVDEPVVFAGTDVTYTYEVQLGVDSVSLAPTDAAGSPVPRDNWVIDPLCASPTYTGGDGGTIGVLEVGEVWVYSCTTTIELADVNGPGTSVINVADVFGRSADNPGASVVTDEAIATVLILEPVVDVSKNVSRNTVLDPPTTCPPSTLTCEPIIGPDAPTPRTVDYVFEVSNPGVVPLDLSDGTLPYDPNDARIVDEVDGALFCAPAYVDGDDGDGLLESDEVWRYECLDVALTKADTTNGFDVPNTVTVTANGILPGDVRSPDTVQAQDTASTQVITPNLTLTKTPSATLVRPGTDVTYTYEVTNTGDPVGLFPFLVIDDRCAPVEYVSGDAAPANGLIDGGETWQFSCTETLDLPDDPDTPAIENTVTNEAIVAAIGPLGNIYVRDATAEVQVFDPDITLTKVVDDDFVPVGTDVTYTFTVTNSGDDVTLDDLTDILLADASDPPQPSCESPTLIDDGDGDDILSVGEVWTYECSDSIQAPTLNVAGVRGTDIADGFVFDFAGAYVAVYEAGIDIVKSASPTVLDVPGGPVTYSYDVTNTGNVPLADVVDQIADDTCSPVTYVSGDDDDNGLLTGDGDLFETGPPEVWTFTCTTIVTRDTVNTVTVEGTPVDPGSPEPLGPNVTDADTAEVIVTGVNPPDVTTTTSVTPFPPTPTIPPTGGGGRSGLPIAALLLLAGGALLMVTRRRRPA